MKSIKGQSTFFKNKCETSIIRKKALREHPQLTPDSFLAFFDLVYLQTSSGEF
jgi:hypothetical protein